MFCDQRTVVMLFEFAETCDRVRLLGSSVCDRLAKYAHYLSPVRAAREILTG